MAETVADVLVATLKASGVRRVYGIPGSTWPVESLTVSEARVLHYLPTYFTAQKIADELYLSVNTVKTHQRHLYQKLGARNRQGAVERARALGLLSGR